MRTQRPESTLGRRQLVSVWIRTRLLGRPQWISTEQVEADHVVPAFDAVLHSPDTDCICLPVTHIEQHESGPDQTIVVHNAFDGRRA